MEIKKEKFINMFFAIMNENGVNSINLDDLTQVIAILYSSNEFLNINQNLNISDMTVQDIIDNKNIIGVYDDGNVEFNYSDDDIESIKNDDKLSYHLVKVAITKLIMCKLIEAKSLGKITFKYDDPDGEYNLPYIGNMNGEFETNIYTDGIITDLGYMYSGIYPKTRNLKVNNSTYTIMADLHNKKTEAVEIRATSNADFQFVIKEAGNIMLGQKNNYNEISKNKPKIYKLKQH